MNFLRTTLLLTALTILLLLIGKALAGNAGMIIAFVVAVVMNFGSYWYSDKLVLRAYRAREASPEQFPQLNNIVKRLAQKAGLPTPKVYIVDNEAPNAFATGRNPEHAAVAATTGILRILNEQELEGVLAHELSHVYHRDTLTSAIAATLAGAISMIANIAQFTMLFGLGREDGEEGPGLLGSLLMMVLAPIAATLIQLAVSRSREYAADEKGAKLCGKPRALASALQKLQRASQEATMTQAQEHPNTAHLFIVNPLSASNLKNLFSTHPSTEDRVRRLEAMAKQGYER